MFSGKDDVDELPERLDVEIEREGFETVGGYILARVGRVPAVGERSRSTASVEVLEAERRRITGSAYSRLRRGGGRKSER